MTAEVDVTLAPGWFPLGPVPGALIAAAAAARDGRAVATMVIRMRHCPGLADNDDADAVFAAVPPTDELGPTARQLRWCGPETVAVLVASAAPDAAVTVDDLA